MEAAPVPVTALRLRQHKSDLASNVDLDTSGILGSPTTARTCTDVITATITY